MNIVFDITVVARFDNVAGGNYQRLFDFGTGPNRNAILFGNVDNSSSIILQTSTNPGSVFNLIIPNAIINGEEATWRATIDDTGRFTIYKNGAVLGTQNLGLGGVPVDVPRTSNLIGESPFPTNADLIGEVISIDLKTTLTNPINITEPEALDDVSSYAGADNSEELDANANTDGIEIDGRGGDDTIIGGTGDDTLTGGTGSNTVTGGAGDDTFVYTEGENLTITDFNTGSTNVGNDDSSDNDSIDLSEYYSNQSELRADLADDGILNHSDAGVGGDFSDDTALTGEIQGLDGIQSLTAAEIADLTHVPCFNAGTLILTENGYRPVECLKVGDQVTTETGRSRVRWIGKRVLDENAMNANPKLRPVRIKVDALGQGVPERDLIVSRQHRMLVSSTITKRMFGETAVLVSAIKLTALPGVFIDHSLETVTYLHLLFDQHQVIFAEGAPTESLFTGPEAMKALSPEVREEIIAIFPEIADLDYAPTTARFIPEGRLQKQLVARHLKNSKPCVPAG